MTIELRDLADGEYEAFYDSLLRAFGGPPEAPEEVRLWLDLLRPGFGQAAWDGGQVVGTSGAFGFRVTVPGGMPVDAAGVTMVSVTSTHRRRGLLTAMMRRLLDTYRDRGVPLAVLTSSEPPIYGRFGFGPATRQVYGTVDVSRVTVAVPPGAEKVRLRLVDPVEGLAACEAVYTRVVPTRPGMLARGPGWERLGVLDPERDRGAFGPLLCVLAEVDGEVRGYARYAVSAGEGAPNAVPNGTVKLRQVDAVDAVTYAALWRYLTEIDLTARLVFRNRPADDPLEHLVSDVRRCDLTWRDALYVRLVDLPAALEARAYAAPLDVVFEVDDAFCPWNAGRWRLTADTAGAACTRTTDPADLALTARGLGSAYLGGHTLRQLAGAGLVVEERAGALAQASAAFRSDVEPWMPHGF